MKKGMNMFALWKTETPVRAEESVNWCYLMPQFFWSEAKHQKMSFKKERLKMYIHEQE